MNIETNACPHSVKFEDREHTYVYNSGTKQLDLLSRCPICHETWRTVLASKDDWPKGVEK